MGNHILEFRELRDNLAEPDFLGFTLLTGYRAITLNSSLFGPEVFESPLLARVNPWYIFDFSGLH